MPVRFFSRNISFSLKKKNQVEKLIHSLIREEREKTGNINYVFCNDAFLLGLNKKFLRHNTFTDIITFQYPSKELSAEIFISVERVKENAKKFSASFDEELHRVIIHGTLHLCGYKDKNPAQKKMMREKENFYLDCLK